MDKLTQHYHESNRKLLVVVSHTSLYDTPIGMLTLKNLGIPVIIFADPFPWLSATIQKKIVNFLTPYTVYFAQESKNVEALSTFLNQTKEFCCIIDPARGNGQHFHSGYFYIAQKTQSRIIVGGWDYLKQKWYTSPQYWIADGRYVNFQKHEDAIKKEVNSIFPYNPPRQLGFNLSHYCNVETQNLPLQEPPTWIWGQVLMEFVFPKLFLLVGLLIVLKRFFFGDVKKKVNGVRSKSKIS